MAAAAARLPANTHERDWFWLRITQDPTRYLQVHGPLVSQTITDELLQSGSGFVVDHPGTRITHQHVIEVGEAPEHADQLVGYFSDALMLLLGELVRIATHLTPSTGPRKLSIRPAPANADWRTNTSACSAGS